MRHASSEAERLLIDACALAVNHSAQGFVPFLHHVVIDCKPDPKPFRLVADPWQWALNAKIAPAFEAVAGIRPHYDGPRRFWFTMPRGHDKTSFIGRAVSHALAFCRKRLRIVAAAGDKDQANYLVDAMEAEAALNPWFAERLDYRHYQVRAPHHSKLVILAADAAGSFGDKPDIMIFDELTHWPKQEVWTALYSGVEKRPDSVVIVITNAGVKRSWQDEVLEVARESPHWFVYEAPGQIASWMSPDRVAEMARMIPKIEAGRVLHNKWIDPSESCEYVTREQAQACADLGIRLGLTFTPAAPEADDSSRPPEYRYVASIDYGPVKDRTVLTVGHRLPDKHPTHPGLVIVDRMDVWQGSKDARVPLDRVEAWIEDVNECFCKPLFVIDPYQMESTIQKYSKMPGYKVEPFEPRGGKANYELAVNLHSLVANELLAWYAGCGDLVVERAGSLRRHTLVDEFAELVLKVMNYGYRIDHEKTGHDDRCVALGMMALALVKLAKRKRLVLSEKFF